MDENGAIFSSAIPGVRQPRPASLDVEASQKQKGMGKGKYLRKPKDAPPPPIATNPPEPTGECADPATGGAPIPCRLEYIQAITRLLELVPETSRERIVTCILGA